MQNQIVRKVSMNSLLFCVYLGDFRMEVFIQLQPFRHAGNCMCMKGKEKEKEKREGRKRRREGGGKKDKKGKKREMEADRVKQGGKFYCLHFHIHSISSLLQTIYELRGSVEPHKSSTVAVRQPANLKYHIRNVAQNDSKQQQPNKLYYCVQVDARH